MPLSIERNIAESRNRSPEHLSPSQIAELRDNQDFKRYDHVFFEKRALVLFVADHAEVLNPEDGTPARDAARMYGLRANGIGPSTINTNDANNVYSGVHCNSSVNDLRRLIRNMKEAFGQSFRPFDYLLSDYLRLPVRIFL